MHARVRSHLWEIARRLDGWIREGAKQCSCGRPATDHRITMCDDWDGVELEKLIAGQPAHGTFRFGASRDGACAEYNSVSE